GLKRRSSREREINDRLFWKRKLQRLGDPLKKIDAPQHPHRNLLSERRVQELEGKLGPDPCWVSLGHDEWLHGGTVIAL
ncbi:hypothetical protein N9977_00970, partial [bacterium]|nr:hypothetical protein [bacterium]